MGGWAAIYLLETVLYISFALYPSDGLSAGQEYSGVIILFSLRKSNPF